jgi:hypothetical protein
MAYIFGVLGLVIGFVLGCTCGEILTRATHLLDAQSRGLSFLGVGSGRRRKGSGSKTDV